MDIEEIKSKERIRIFEKIKEMKEKGYITIKCNDFACGHYSLPNGKCNEENCILTKEG